MAASEVTNPEVQAIYPNWSPEQEAVRPGKAIKFVNANGLPHGVRWTGGPTAPICTGVPINSSSSSWNGSCTFQNEGTYTFECTVHPIMKGTIYVNSTGTIPPPPPMVTTESAGSITETGATFKGTVNPEGQATEYFFEYGTTTSYGSKTSPQSAGAGSSNVTASASVTGLLPGTPYHFRLVATYASGSGKALGGDSTFTTTSPPGPPRVTTESATGLAESGATLNGIVNPDGETTKYFFEWSTDMSFGARSKELTLGANDHAGHSVSTTLEGLTPSTTYHFKVVAENASGTVEGAEKAFTTASKAEPPTQPKEPTPTPTPSSTPASTPGPIAPAPEIAPLVPPLVEGSLKLTAPRHGSSVHGSLDASSSAAGARLEIDLIAKTVSLATARQKRSPVTVVGRLVRSSVSAGKVSFSISLNARAKSALRRHHKLALTVKITLTPISGSAEVITRGVVLHA